MLTKENITTLRRFATMYSSINQKDTVLAYLTILTLKYASESGLGAINSTDFPVYAKVMKYFASGDSYPKEELETIIGRIADHTGCDPRYMMYSFNATFATWLFNNIEIEKLPGWNLAEKKDEERKAELRSITESVNLISSMYYGSSRLGTAYNVVYNIASQILNVEKDDTFADLVAGQGISTFLITNGEAADYVLADNVADEAVSLLSILYGIPNVRVANVSLETGIGQSGFADKMFMDPPINVSLYDKIVIDGIEVRDTNSASILRMLEALKPGGIGIVTAAGKTLIGNNGYLVETRAKLLDGCYLKAVITLPPCWIGASVKTNFIVISKEKNEGVVFIDASISKIVGPLGEELMDVDGNLLVSRIISLIENKETSMISKFVPYDEIDRMNLTPIAYIGRQTSSDDETIEDLDEMLSAVYGKMAKVIDELKK